MFRIFVIFSLSILVNAFAAETPAPGLWAELTAKREKLNSFHQEFDVNQTSKRADKSQSSKRQLVLDVSQAQWREKSITGSGTYIRLFDGADLIRTEEGSEEFVRIKRRTKDDDPSPWPYVAGGPDWIRAMELERRPCGLSNKDRPCVLIRAPLKPWSRAGVSGNASKMLQGFALVFADTGPGLSCLYAPWR